MPKKIAPEVREKAMELYLQGDLTAKDISEELQRIFKVDVKVPTIYAWSRDSKWNDKQIEARAESMERVQESESARFARMQKEHLNTHPLDVDIGNVIASLRLKNQECEASHFLPILR